MLLNSIANVGEPKLNISEIPASRTVPRITEAARCDVIEETDATIPEKFDEYRSACDDTEATLSSKSQDSR